MEKVLFVYNPNAGKGALRGKLSQVIDLMMEAQFDVTIYATRKAKDASDIVEKRGAAYDRVICSGGDGTLHEVVYGLMQIPVDKRPKCGYIPTGTVNDFANGIKLPKRILPAAQVAVGTQCAPYDLGDLNGEYFTYVAAFGAFTSVSYETPQPIKNLLGKPAYLLEGVIKLNTLKSIPVEVTVDGETWKEDCILGMVTNARTVGGMNLYRHMKIALDDGYFDGIFVRTPRNPIELNLVLDFFLTGRVNSQMRIIHGRSITIKSNEKIAYTLDGESGGKHKKAVITNHHQAITYFHG